MAHLAILGFIAFISGAPSAAGARPPRTACERAAVAKFKTVSTPQQTRMDSQLNFERGLALQKLGQHQAALSAFEIALVAAPSNGLIHLAKTESHMFLDDRPEQLAQHLLAAINFLPNNPRARFLYARWLMQQEQAENAERQFLCALELRPEFIEARLAYGELLLAKGRIADAKQQASQNLAQKPGDTESRLLLARIFESDQAWHQAALQVEYAAEAVRSAALYRRASALYQQAGMDQAAMFSRFKADRIDPPEPERTLRPLLQRRRP